MESMEGSLSGSIGLMTPEGKEDGVASGHVPLIGGCGHPHKEVAKPGYVDAGRRSHHLPMLDLAAKPDTLFAFFCRKNPVFLQVAY